MGAGPGVGHAGAFGNRRAGEIGYQRCMESDDVMVVLSTFPDEGKAGEVAGILVERQVAACVNVVGGVRSIYHWQGEVRNDCEVLAVIKTTRGRYAELEAALLELHPYEVPEILALPVATGAPAYQGWVRVSLGLSQ